MESTRLVVLFVSNQLFGILQVYPAGIVSTALMSSYSLDNLIDLIQRGLMCNHGRDLSPFVRQQSACRVNPQGRRASLRALLGSSMAVTPRTVIAAMEDVATSASAHLLSPRVEVCRAQQ